MEEKVKNIIETYQCPGCVCGSDISCYEKGEGVECKKHCAGTTISHIGRIFLGMPTGFCRLGPCDETKIYIFEDPNNKWDYKKFNIPVWKYLDEHGNTIIRGLSPRINVPWIHIFIGDHRNKFLYCLEITNEDIAEMD